MSSERLPQEGSIGLGVEFLFLMYDTSGSLLKTLVQSSLSGADRVITDQFPGPHLQVVARLPLDSTRLSPAAFQRTV